MRARGLPQVGNAALQLGRRGELKQQRLRHRLVLGLAAVEDGDLPEQVPPEGGLLIDADENMAAALAAAVIEVATTPERFHGGMRVAAQACDWKPIARSYFDFLSTKA